MSAARTVAQPVDQTPVVTPAPELGRGRATRVIVALVTLYQHLSAHRPSPCRFAPSCSSYALEAVEVHGAGRGSWLAIRRLSRCHPLGGHGFDPVPPPGPRAPRSRPHGAHT